MSAKPIASFDLDMTLLDHNTWEIPPSAMKALGRLRQTHYIVIASGRDMDNHYSTMFRDIVNPDAIIHMNGTKITVGDKLIFEHNFDKALLSRLLHFAEEQGYSVGATLDGRDYFMNPKKVEAHDKTRWDISDRHFEDPWDLMERNVRTLAFIGNEIEAKAVEAHFPELKLPMFAGKLGADVVEAGSSKGDGLVRLCEYLGSDVCQSIAFGDSMNDWEILKQAGTGVAMGNAIEELKAAADYITDRIDEDGVWNACIHFGLFQG